MSLHAKIRGLVLEGLVKLTDTTKKALEAQIAIDDEDVADEVPVAQPQGVRFRPPTNSEAVVVAIGGEGSHPVALAAFDRDSCPTDSIEEGEGGLYYAGTFRVFLDASGEVHLGAMAASDAAAVASLVEAELDKIRSAIAGAGVTPNDGGAAFKAAILGAWGTRGAVGSSKVKIEP